jgi:hypothetical protein
MNALAVYVGNNTLGCDPTPGQVKKLRVDYRYQGHFRQASKLEQSLLVIPEDEMHLKELALLQRKLEALEKARQPSAQLQAAQEERVPQEKLLRLVRGYVSVHPDQTTMVLSLEIEVVNPKRFGSVRWSLKISDSEGNAVPCSPFETVHGIRFQSVSRGQLGSPATQIGWIAARPIDPEFPRAGYAFFKVASAGDFFKYVFGCAFQVLGFADGGISPILLTEVHKPGRWLKEGHMPGNYQLEAPSLGGLS